jgi:MerR family copper efflux transcriptional regulator
MLPVRRNRLQGLTTGQLARRAGVNGQTIRYYRRRGLLPEPPRSPSGYRYFPEDAVRRIRFIKRGQQLGFSLEEIKELLALRVQPGATCAQVRRRAEAKIQDVNQRIRALEVIRTALERLAASCAGRGPVSECPILENLFLDGEGIREN